MYIYIYIIHICIFHSYIYIYRERDIYIYIYMRPKEKRVAWPVVGGIYELVRHGSACGGCRGSWWSQFPHMDFADHDSGAWTSALVDTSAIWDSRAPAQRCSNRKTFGASQASLASAESTWTYMQVVGLLSRTSDTLIVILGLADVDPNPFATLEWC